MKNKFFNFHQGLKLFSMIFSLLLVLYLIPCCGGDGGGLGNSPSKSLSGVSKKKPVASYKAYVDARNGTITFEYADAGVKVKKGSAKKQYTSQPGPGMPGLQVTMASSGVTWDSGPKTLTGNVTITNNTSGPGEIFYGTYATIESISVGSVSVINEYGYDPSGYPYFNHAPDGASIAPSVTGSAVTWKFHDPDAVNFSFSGNVYADNWHQIAGDGIASTAWENADADKGDKIFIDSMTAFNGKLYVTMGKQVHPARDTGKQNDFPGGIGTGTGITGAEVWEYEPTGGTWSQINADGFGGAEDYLNFGYNNWGTSLAGFNGFLYAGTSKAAIFGNGQTDPNNQQGAEIWRWSGSGTTWTKVHSMTDTKAIKDLLEFDGNLFATGYFRGYNKTPGTVTQARFDYSPTGSAGSWNIVMSDAFGDIDEQGTYGTSISSAVSNVQFGTSDKYLFFAKGGITAKPGAQIYRAGPANGTGKGTTYTNGVITGARGDGNWVTNGDWTKITDITSDDIYATITAAPALINGSSMYICTVTFSTTPLDHELAHHWAHNDTLGRSSVTIIDNKGSTLIYGIHANDHVPASGNKLRLTKGPNERGLSETANGTSFDLFAFAPSTEGTASPVIDNTLLVSTNNLPQGVQMYFPSGAELYFSSNAGTSAGTVDSDWIRKVDLFTGDNGSALGITTPTASGGATLESLSSIAGFNKRDDFTATTGSHEGWLYAAVYPFQRTNTGFRLYKSADGANWIKITGDGFGDPFGKGFVFVSLNGKLYMSTSRQQFSTSVASSSNTAAGITETTSTFYVTDPTFGTPSVRFTTAGTLVLDKSTNADVNNYVPESSIFIEKVNYTGNKVATALTLTTALPANDGTLASHVWATDTTIVLSSVASLPASGAIVVESEVIQYGAISGTTLRTLTDPGGSPGGDFSGRGSRGPRDHGIANHPKGTPVFRTTRNGTGDYGIVLSGTTGLPASCGGAGNNQRRILIDDEEIYYNSITGLTLWTPMRGVDVTDVAAHSAPTTIYRAGFTGITRGQHGTTATTWAGAEGVSGGIVMGTAELWVTD